MAVKKGDIAQFHQNRTRGGPKISLFLLRTAIGEKEIGKIPGCFATWSYAPLVFSARPCLYVFPHPPG